MLPWQVKVGDGLAAPAQFIGENLVVATAADVIALDPESGQEIWRLSPLDGVWPRSLASEDGRIFVGVPGGLMAIEVHNGQIL